jgi:hypothetical protein
MVKIVVLLDSKGKETDDISLPAGAWRAAAGYAMGKRGRGVVLWFHFMWREVLSKILQVKKIYLVYNHVNIKYSNNVI